MKKFKKHIVVFLLGIFVFPIIFQSIHIVWHHTHAVLHNENVSIIENCNIHNNEIVLISDNIEHCAICEYEFSVNNVPNGFYFDTVLLFIKDLVNQNIVNKALQQIFSFKTPRAPPSSI